MNVAVIPLGESVAWIQVTRPTNHHVLARFSLFTDYRYQLLPNTHIKVGVDYAWCRGCDAFAESERIWTTREIETNHNNLLLLSRDDPTEHRKQLNGLANDWLLNRISPPKCLACGSSFGITKVETGLITAHPNGDGMITIGSDDTLGGGPPIACPVYFDPDGNRLGDSNAG